MGKIKLILEYNFSWQEKFSLGNSTNFNKTGKNPTQNISNAAETRKCLKTKRLRIPIFVTYYYTNRKAPEVNLIKTLISSGATFFSAVIFTAKLAAENRRAAYLFVYVFAAAQNRPNFVSVLITAWI